MPGKAFCAMCGAIGVAIMWSLVLVWVLYWHLDNPAADASEFEEFVRGVAVYCIATSCFTAAALWWRRLSAAVPMLPGLYWTALVATLCYYPIGTILAIVAGYFYLHGETGEYLRRLKR
jgi:hypothetical protein